MSKLYKQSLENKYFFRLMDIFKLKHWDIDDNLVNKVFEKFCHRLSDLNSDEKRDLILDLTEKYTWIQIKMYESYYFGAFKELFKSYEWKNFESSELRKGKLCITSLSLNVNQIKSGEFLLYLVQSILMRTCSFFDNEQIYLHNNVELINEKSDDFSGIIYIDDYIGSGTSTLEKFATIEKVKCKKFIVCLAAQQEAIKLIKSQLNVNVYTNSIQKRGISDNYVGEERNEKLNLMKEISNDLNASKCSLGYNDTEALISLLKTPNNTFPVFWIENKKHKNAPFARKNNIRFEEYKDEEKCGTVYIKDN